MKGFRGTPSAWIATLMIRGMDILPHAPSPPYFLNLLDSMTQVKNYRPLKESEISRLIERGCTSDDWTLVEVTDSFNPERLTAVELSGNVRIGKLEGSFPLPGGLRRHAGISHATLHNVTVGDNVYINNIANYISNYDISDGVFIDNVDCIMCTLDSTFGLGTEVSVLNETGGREVPLYESLSAQSAYLIAMYRHRPIMIEKLRKMILNHAEKYRGQRGCIGRRATITNAGLLTNVMVGEYAHIEGATRLDNGYIAGSEADPVIVGRGVIADGFVFASGAKVEDGAVVHHCFVGQASSLSHLFSAHDSLFFANCACENGEAAAIFGGPYTVTMHKSSLLIAGMFSFLNAGSGSNQSNHMYKLGPIHQGVVERGSKTTSDSYILWPAKIGPFSLVMGRHVTHPDTSRLPFSYLIENHGASYLVPGINLRSVGTVRDAQKWPKRDKRKDKNKLDSINFNLLSPFTIGRMMRGIRLLDDLERTAGRTAERFTYQTMTIEARALRKGRDFYRMAITKFMGNSVIHRLRGVDIESDEQLQEILAPTHPAGKGIWIDLSGMIAPQTEIEILCDDIAQGRITELSEVESRLRKLHSEYYDMEWTWVADNMEKWWGKPLSKLTREDVRAMVYQWRDMVVSLDKQLYEDARKEFNITSRVGFGVDGKESEADTDFAEVRGEFDKDPFVKMVLGHIEQKSALAEDLLARIK